jgi:predicted O-linked N-acetylglucosamine transferase (SPINDLY family)
MVPTMLHESFSNQRLALEASDLEKFAYLQKWTIGDLFQHAEKTLADGDPASSVALYKSWIACNPTNPALHAAYFNYGVALAKGGDRLGAINATRECIRLKPDFFSAYINLGRLLEDAGQAREAIEQWQALAAKLPQINGESVQHKLVALHQLGRVLESHLLDAAAEDTMKHSIEISIAQPEMIQHWIALRMRQCKWPVVTGWAHVKANSLMAGISPLSLANLLDDPMFQLGKAWKYSVDFIKPVANPRALPVHTPGRPRRSEKLRIGYVSSDLREHAVGFAMTDVFEQHDRNHFEIHAYYCGINRLDPTRARIKGSADRWTEINGLSDEEAAAKIMADEVDILVDLNGYTKDARTRVFALRPAPIAVNWFGFPGTMGTPYHHYIVADDTTIPEGGEIYYSEKVVRLACYQPNDRKRIVSANRPMRSDEGLPDQGFVYCCLNGMQKITASIFEAWMTILKEAPGSVLWLLGGDPDTDARLKTLAEQSGVAPDRLIMAKKKPNPEHVARYALADLFLDTFPYGAHTTAADAMWMGVPVLTVPGVSFATRVCASVAKSAGVGEFVCADKETYVARAVEFGRNPEKIAPIRQKLLDGRQSSLLFDTPKLVRDLEDLYRGMWREFQDGRRPVPDLSNLDMYHDIGLELAVDGATASTPEAYRQLYRDKLETRNCVSPVQADSRMWPAAG